ncbi:MAG: inositol monophosphatase [Ignavibacteriales bacterium]|nr:MAG: inositol monophosphatase [Ignavibacteriales bacterium]
MIEDIIQISKAAGEIIRDGFGKNVGIDFKTNESNLVTETDKASEKLIKEFIERKYPTHSILAEESGRLDKSGEYVWVVDPLDGTTNFAHKFPIFSVSIGVQKNGRTVAGVVYDVMQDNIYAAEIGGGAFINGIKISVSETKSLGRSLLVTGFPYNISDNPENAFQKFAALTKASRGMRRLGSAAIDFCYVARGVFDGFWEVFLNPWDICAGKLILEEAGGIVTDFIGTEINIDSKRILASNGKIHGQMVEILSAN